MGMLSYFVREDGTGERFALNKAHLYMRDGFCEYGGVAPLPSPRVMRRCWFERDFDGWSDRIVARLVAWANGQPVRLTSEYDDDATGLITGSSFDRDYEPDGVTYRAGSAW